MILDEAKGIKLIEWPSYLYQSYQIIFVQDVGHLTVTSSWKYTGLEIHYVSVLEFRINVWIYMQFAAKICALISDVCILFWKVERHSFHSAMPVYFSQVNMTRPCKPGTFYGKMLNTYHIKVFFVLFCRLEKTMDSFLNMFGNEVKHSYSVARARIDKRLGKMSSLHHNLRICNIISF